MAPYIGDIAAETISQSVQSGGYKAKRWIGQKQEYLAQAVTEEWRLAPGRLEVVHFGDETEILSQQVDSLAQRIEKLEKAR